MTPTSRHLLYQAWDQSEIVCVATSLIQFLVATAYLVTRDDTIPLWLALGALPQLIASSSLGRQEVTFHMLPLAARERGLFLWLSDGGMAAAVLLLTTIFASIIPFSMLEPHFDTHRLVTAMAYPIGLIGLSQFIGALVPNDRVEQTDPPNLVPLLLAVVLLLVSVIFSSHVGASTLIAKAIIALGTLSFAACFLRPMWYAEHHFVFKEQSVYAKHGRQRAMAAIIAHLPWVISLLGWRLPLSLALGVLIALSTPELNHFVTQHWVGVIVITSLFRIERSQPLNTSLRALRVLPMSAGVLSVKLMILNALPVVAFLFSCTLTGAAIGHLVSIKFVEYVVLFLTFTGMVHSAEYRLVGEKGHWWIWMLVVTIGLALIYLILHLAGIALHAAVVSLAVSFQLLGCYWLQQAIRRGGYNFLRKINNGHATEQ